MLRSDLFEVSPAPALSGDRAGLPGHVAPVEGEALVSWVAALSTQLGMPPRVLCRDAFGVDVRQDRAWWRRPDPEVLARIGSRTGIDRTRLVAMTLDEWAVTPGDEEADRFAASRWTVRGTGKVHPGRIDVCPLCLAEAPRPHLQLIWTLGWAGACPRHGMVLSGRCPSCGKRLRLRGLDGSVPFDPLCGRCASPLIHAECLPAHPAALDLQAVLVAGKRSGTAILPGIGALDWPTTMALAEVLLAMVWTRRTKKQRDYLAPRRRNRLFGSIGRDLGMAGSEWEGIPWKENYGGLLLLAWLLGDLDQRLPGTLAMLHTARLDGLLAPFADFDDAMKDRLRSILAVASAKRPEGRRAWKPWLNGLPESAAELRERATRERYKHRRQRLRALAELKEGTPVEAVAALVGVNPHSVYHWLHRGAAGGLEAALERPAGKPALTSAQAEAMGQWIADDHRHQNRQAIAEQAKEVFAVDLNLDAASKLLAKHRRARPGRRRRLWAPRQRAGSTHDPAPGR